MKKLGLWDRKVMERERRQKEKARLSPIDDYPTHT